MKAYDRSPFFYGWVIAGASFVLMVVCSGMMSGYAVFIEPMARNLSWSRSTVVLGSSLNYMAFGASALIMGYISTKWGLKKSVFLGGALYGLGLILSSFVHQSYQLYLFFGLMTGVGNGSMYGPVATIIAYWFNKRKGLATGLVFSGSGAATIIFPSLGRYLIASYDWRFAFLMIGLGALCLNFLAALFLKEKPADMGLRAYGDEDQAGVQDGGNNVKAPSEASMTSPSPVVWTSTSAARTRSYWSIMFTNFFCCVCHSITLLHTVSYAVDMGISRAVAAFTLSLAGVFIITGRVGLGALSDLIGSERTLLFALASQAFAAIWLLVSHSTSTFYIWALFFGLGFGGTFSQYPVLTRNYFGLGPLAAIFGSQMGVSTVAMAIGGFFGGFFYDFTGSYNAAFIFSFLSGLASLVVAWGLKAPEAPPLVLKSQVQMAE
ncbi:MAG: MFS transporter [Candidatus Tectomicrobia bacterium]|uniref:MFS transporter n=1 Tax=Tectimicrobiota bacterium TaxID=2528274 RepID=A0A933GLI7_UNCTE|nr:MFS transporter [Candidatus Tectomicrobia bacterium]